MNEITASPHTSLAAALRDRGFTGRLVEPGDPDYDRVRPGWNGAVDRRPAAVALARDSDDVAAVVLGCRDADLELTVRGGGHSVVGRSLRDGAVCLDLRELCAVEVDPESRTARVGGGALLRQLDEATQRHGLAVPAGQISHTGVGGLALGGGLGWLMRHHGLTVDSLLAAQVVLADGRTVTASPDEHPDLFWALRGGGGDFGVVTRFEFQAHPVGPVLGGMMLYSWDRAGEAMRITRGIMESAPPELTTFCAMITAPPQEPFPPELQGKPVLAATVAWSGADHERGEEVLRPLREGFPPALDLVAPMPYNALQTMLDETAPPGLRYYDRLHYLPAVSDGFVDTLIECFDGVPTPQTHVMTGWMGGAIDRVGSGETAFGHRGARALTWMIGCSAEDPLEPAAAWVKRTWERTAPFAAEGVYVNALDADRRARDAYAADVWERLVRVKRRYDPEGVFSGNGIG